MICIEYNGSIKQKPVVVIVPGNILRKIIGSKRYKKDRKSTYQRWLSGE